MAKDTKKSLQHYLPMLEDAGMVGLVEPLGFPESSLRDTALAAEIVSENRKRLISADPRYVSLRRSRNGPADTWD